LHSSFEQMYDILTLNGMKVAELKEIAEKLGIKYTHLFKKQELIFKIIDEQSLRAANDAAPAPSAAAAEVPAESNVENVEEEKGDKRRERARKPAAEKIAKGEQADQAPKSETPADLFQGDDHIVPPLDFHTEAPVKKEEPVQAAEPKPEPPLVKLRQPSEGGPESNATRQIRLNQPNQGQNQGQSQGQNQNQPRNERNDRGERNDRPQQNQGQNPNQGQAQGQQGRTKIKIKVLTKAKHQIQTIAKVNARMDSTSTNVLIKITQWSFVQTAQNADKRMSMDTTSMAL
jgi:Rho termination factor, N-terminal domain